MRDPPKAANYWVVRTLKTCFEIKGSSLHTENSGLNDFNFGIVFKVFGFDKTTMTETRKET